MKANENVLDSIEVASFSFALITAQRQLAAAAAAAAAPRMHVANIVL